MRPNLRALTDKDLIQRSIDLLEEADTVLSRVKDRERVSGDLREQLDLIVSELHTEVFILEDADNL